MVTLRTINEHYSQFRVNKQKRTRYTLKLMNKQINTLKLKLKKLDADTIQNRAESVTTPIKIDNRETPQMAQVNLRELMTYHEDGRCTNAFNLITSKPMLLAAY